MTPIHSGKMMTGYIRFSSAGSWKQYIFRTKIMFIGKKTGFLIEDINTRSFYWDPIKYLISGFSDKVLRNLLLEYYSILLIFILIVCNIYNYSYINSI
ncbi:unnamed protein product [Hymenolepis diminuta]|uniref:Uncharacterized protein n=1 Tax=Hymenolepis diminuta TaxID=6216 RepID=A0A0R3S8I8_HYMDI|nr:unnamed protein product [Hymenolepis diminuta]